MYYYIYIHILFFIDSLLLSSVKSTECLFICSTLQCINLTSVCDGVIDCDNGQDEYCREPGQSVVFGTVLKF